MKTSELTGAELDYWVAKANGMEVGPFDPDPEPDGGFMADGMLSQYLHFSSDWAQGGPIIERERITTVWDGRANEVYRRWNAYVFPICSAWPPQYHQGETALIAAMRAYVASKCGDEVPHD